MLVCPWCAIARRSLPGRNSLLPVFPLSFGRSPTLGRSPSCISLACVVWRGSAWKLLARAATCQQKHPCWKACSITLETYERSGIGDVVRAYQEMLVSSRTPLYRKLPYGYDTLLDGVDIGDWMITLYRSHNQLLKFGNMTRVT